MRKQDRAISIIFLTPQLHTEDFPNPAEENATRKCKGSRRVTKHDFYKDSAISYTDFPQTGSNNSARVADLQRKD